VTYDKHLYHFKPRNLQFEENSPYQKDALYCHNYVSRVSLEMGYPGTGERILAEAREMHRRSVGNALIRVIYDGWFPYETEWWEGRYDDPALLRGYEGSDILTTDDYHFWTRIRIYSQRAYILQTRGNTFAMASVNEAPTFARHIPTIPRNL